MNEEKYPSHQDADSLTPQEADAVLAEIERTLDHMLVLAEVSASSLNVDRAALQATLERLQKRIDQLAGQLSDMSGNIAEE